MSKKPEETLQFEFQPIKLDDLQKVLPAQKHGKYDLIKTQILERIATLPGNESILLQPSNGTAKKLTDGLKKSCVNSLNAALREAREPWHVVWSEIAHAFALAPFARHGRIKRPVNGDRFPMETKAVRNAKLDKLIAAAVETFGISAKKFQMPVPNKSPDFDPAVIMAKRAMLHVGRENLGLTISAIGRFFKSSNAHQLHATGMSPAVKQKISELTAALNRRESK